MNHFTTDLSSCVICPRNCSVNRKNKHGLCQKGNEMEISWYGPHFGEEPPISGTKGSGTIFFTGCNLSCVYCQNWQISQKNINAREVSVNQLVDIFLDLQKEGCHNINLVSPTIYTLQLIEVIKNAKKKKLVIPVVWNSNAYENVSTLKKLRGLVDVYLPDYKYADSTLSLKYSNAPGYTAIAQKAIREMYKQVGDLKIEKNGLAKKGLIIRHLVLPNYLENIRKCLEFIRSISDKVHLSLMSQYNPQYKADQFPEINRSLNKEEFEFVREMVSELDFQYGWIQEFGGAVKCLNPDFQKPNPF